MATSFLKKTMVHLGLLDDEYDEYDDYEDRAPRGFSSVAARAEPRGFQAPEPEDRGPAQIGRIRTLQRDTASPSAAAAQPNQGAMQITPRAQAVRPVAQDAAKVQVVAPARFGDAKDIADCLKVNRPVILNLQLADRDLQRRMIDFCSGVAYALSGEMEKVANQVFLLTPSNVKVSEEERQRLQERGYGQP